MNKNKAIYIDKSGVYRLKLRLWEKVLHYGIVIAETLAFLALLTLIILYGSYPSLRLSWENIAYLLSILLIFLSIYHYKWLNRSLIFRVFSCQMSRQQLNTVLYELKSNITFNVVENNHNFIVIETIPRLFSGSWGERVTIVLKKDRILVNSICNPKNWNSVLSTNWNNNYRNIRLIADKIESQQTA